MGDFTKFFIFLKIGQVPFYVYQQFLNYTA